MAYADYTHCAICDGKAFYDACLDYQDKPVLNDKHTMMPGNNCGDMKALCVSCAKTHKLVVEKI